MTKQIAKPAAIIIKPVPDDLWLAILKEQERVITNNPARTTVLYREALTNIIKRAAQ